MTIIDRYILKEFIKILALILASLMGLYLIVDFFERIRMFLSNHASVGQMASYFLLTLPMILSQMIPIAVLLSTLLSFGILSKNCEITAMKANGLSLYRLSLPVIVTSFAICIAAFLLNEFITPYTNQKAKYVKFVEVQKRENLGSFKQNQIWYKAKKGIYNFSVFDSRTNTLKGIRINLFDRGMNLYERIDAKDARWEDGKWVFRDLLVTTFPENGFPLLERIPSRVMDFPEIPSDFMAVQKSAEEMGLVELNRFIKKIRSEGYDTNKYRTDMHGKIAFPLVSIILAILGVSFSLKSERSGGIAQSIGTGIIIGFSYWVVFAFAISLGRSGAIPPVIAAWTANLILGLAALIMFMRVKT
ncbi:MAG: LPS export ABC transporter permease LptG [Deltaproteobacteria bacterium]|nr:LPS export ABC transporter permease LptG [Deltaproteobacteria bacterium]MBW2594808.1 LPS export ABC transporter permease LptG [Deltaproteobacteria bacterium]MBW2649548.1 LPS export ABC transporter permease LptG [Deltaproteobacteria bacterium]